MTTKLRDLSFSMRDRLFALSALICGFLYWQLPGSHGPGIGATLLVIIMVAYGLIYTHSYGFRQNRRSLIILVIILLCGLNLFIFDNFVERTLAYFFAQILYIYWIAIAVGNMVDKKLSLYTLAEMAKKFFVVPFANFGALFASFFFGGKKEKARKGVLMALLGLVLAIPLLLVVTKLLISADVNFARVIISIPMMFSQKIIIYTGHFILGIPVALYLYGYVFGETRGRYAVTKKESLDLAATQVAVIPGGVVYAILSSLSLLYLVFMAVQAASLFGGFMGHLPVHFTYAEFAREGFFQLCQVVVINGIVCGFAYVFIKNRKAKGFRILMAIMAVFTTLLCATAMSKMMLYIDSYGLTQLRVYTFWFMALVLILCIIVFLRQFISFNGTRTAAVAFVLCFMVLIYGNVDGQIAKYNVERYKAGTLKEIDGGVMFHLSAGAVPYLVETYEITEDESFKSNIAFIVDQYEDTAYRGWNNFNIQRWKEGKGARPWDEGANL